MKITLTKVKHAKFASEETECFEAIVCLDGVPCIYAENDGNGGSTCLHSLPNHKGSVERLMAYAASLPAEVSTTLKDPQDPSKPFAFERTADGLVDDAFGDWLDMKEMRRALNKKAMFWTGGVLREFKFNWEFLLKYHPGLVDGVKKQYADAVWLNPLPETEALTLWRTV
jgi:hypothetical protein